MILAINGVTKSGKDTVATMFQYHAWINRHGIIPRFSAFQEICILPGCIDILLNGSGWQQKKLGYKLKAHVADMLNVPHEVMETREFKEGLLGPEWGNIKGVELQIAVGDGLRRVAHPDYWINGLMSSYTHDQNWIITDMRYPNEFAKFSELGLTVRVVRSGITSPYPTDHHLDNEQFNYTIQNSGSLEDLFNQVGVLAGLCTSPI